MIAENNRNFSDLQREVATLSEQIAYLDRHRRQQAMVISELHFLNKDVSHNAILEAKEVNDI